MDSKADKYKGIPDFIRDKIEGAKLTYGKTYTGYRGNKFQRVLVAFGDGKKATVDVRIRDGYNGQEMARTDIKEAAREKLRAIARLEVAARSHIPVGGN